MKDSLNIIGDWFWSQNAIKTARVWKGISMKMSHLKNQPVEQLTNTLAAGLMAACADDLGLSIVELAGLLKTPKQDAIASLVTVLRDA